MKEKINKKYKPWKLRKYGYLGILIIKLRRVYGRWKSRKYLGLLKLRNEKILIKVNRKVASRSVRHLYHTLKNQKPFIIKKIFNKYKKVILVRNPYNRILSTYNDNTSYPFIHICLTNTKYTGTRLTFEEFVDKICDTPDDISNDHYVSQTYGFHDFNPEYIIKLEDMIGWSELGLPELTQHTKPSIKIITEIPNHLKEKIYNRYKNDFKLLNYEK